MFVTQEIKPYTTETHISELVRRLPQFSQEKGMEIRVLMPRYGTINERRHRLHEVVRLSGMNIIVDDEDYPLIIKVASLPGARIQVYFLDNEEFFKRKQVFSDSAGNPFKDNAERMIFFCKGVIETVKKFGWPPDIIHCHGWLTSLIPLYIRAAYENEPLFKKSQIIYSVYNNDLGSAFSKEFIEKAQINNLTEEHLQAFQKQGKISLTSGGIKHADAVIQGEEEIEDQEVAKLLTALDKPFLEHKSMEEFLAAYLEFYKGLIEN